VRFEQYEFTVQALDRMRIQRVKLTIHPEEEEA